MKISIAVTNYSWTGRQARLPQTLAAVARRAEEAGVDTVWVADHLLQMEPGAAVDELMRGAHHPRFPRGGNGSDRARHDGHLGDHPAARPDGQGRQHAGRVVRYPADVEVILSSRLDPGESGAAFADRCARLEGEGIRHIVLVGNGPWTDPALDVVGEAVELLRAA